jgi:3-hydroxyacyl-CoA dehydrogenase
MSRPVWLRYRDDVALIGIDNPPVNAIGQAVRAALLAALDEALASPAKAIVLYGAGRGFSGGADIAEFNSTIGGPDLSLSIERCESTNTPVIAAIHGIALGGALELALGCSYRIATPDARVGLPEVKIGVLPGGGGTQRLPRLIGVKEAIDWMVSGDPVPASAALSIGVIDVIVDGNLIDGAVAFARTVFGKVTIPIRNRSEKITGVAPEVFDMIRAEVAKRSRNLVAPLKIVDAVQAACTLPFEQGLKEERRLFEECLATMQSRSLVHVFFAEREVRKIPDVPADTPLRPIKKAAIIGAGTMGGGIAMSFANAGVPVDLIEVDAATLDRGLGRIRSNYAGTVSKGRLTQEAMDARMALLTPTTDIAAVADADIVIEAVFERMDVKLDIFRKLDLLAKPAAILATNTSMLDINRIAAETGRPQDVIGTHFFSPASVMRLLEVVRGARTDKDVLATVLSVAQRIGKIPVVVGVCDGFVGNRMIEPYFREAEFLVAEGASPADVDHALTDFGLAMGPFAMADMAGVDVRWDVVKRKATLRRPGERYSALVDRLGEAGRFGQKTNAGFYRYEPGSRTPIPDPAIDAQFVAEAARQGVRRRTISAEEIVNRCLYALVNEGADILDERIAARAGDIDVIYVDGYGFPAYRGGPMFWADTVGLPKIHADIERLHQEFGDHWRPSPLLARLAAQRRRFSGKPQI